MTVIMYVSLLEGRQRGVAVGWWSSAVCLSVSQEEKMLSSAEVPRLLQRSHVHFGYRPPNQSPVYYVTSAFRLHNELVRVNCSLFDNVNCIATNPNGLLI